MTSPLYRPLPSYDSHPPRDPQNERDQPIFASLQQAREANNTTQIFNKFAEIERRLHGIWHNVNVHQTRIQHLCDLIDQFKETLTHQQRQIGQILEAQKTQKDDIKAGITSTSHDFSQLQSRISCLQRTVEKKKMEERIANLENLTMRQGCQIALLQNMAHSHVFVVACTNP